MFNYIIFDFDGTLVDSKDVVIPVYNQLAAKYRFKKMEPEDFEFLRGLSIKDRCRFLNFPLYKLPFFVAEFYNLYRDVMKNLHFFDGIKELLDELHNKGFHLAVISSNSEHNIKEFLQKYQIDYIKQVLCSNKIFGKDKVIKKFLKINRLKNSDIIYVGDEQRDIFVCKKSGVKVIWVTWGFDPLEIVKQENPDYIANTPGDILNLVSS